MFTNQAWREIFNWTSNIVDILVLWFLIYYALKFVRNNTRTVQIFKGIILILAAKFFANLFGLQAVGWLADMFVSWGFVAVIIIFQPEIREALERLGNGSIHGIMSIGDQKNKKIINYATVDAVCSAVRELSSSNTGALIVITRTTQFDDVINTGVKINADVNSYLLRNLFFNKAPLHDGAVIIDDGRIAAAGCLLPLTRRTDVDGDLGTRHRAALGMSEVSDAIIVIVSEETGIISVAYDCTLTRNFTPETLRKFLLHKILNEQSEDEAN